MLADIPKAILTVWSLLVWTAAAVAEPSRFPGQAIQHADLSAQQILAQAYKTAGGPTWLRPRSLHLKGYSIHYDGTAETHYDRYEMIRVYSADKQAAHEASGRVRIEAWQAGRSRFLLAFDGTHTYTAAGRLPDKANSKMWQSNFGFGAIRHGLDEGWHQKRLPDDMIDGKPAMMVELTDPEGGTTRFAFAADDFRILYVGFDTPRGWHERRYSDFFTKESIRWLQPGRVRLFYNGVKQNEVVWQDFLINQTFDEAVFKP